MALMRRCNEVPQRALARSYTRWRPRWQKRERAKSQTTTLLERAARHGATEAVLDPSLAPSKSRRDCRLRITVSSTFS